MNHAQDPPSTQALTFDVEGGIGTAGFLSSNIIPSHTLESTRILKSVHSCKAQAAALGKASLGVLDGHSIEQPVHLHRARGLNLTAEQRPAPLQSILGRRLLDEDDRCLDTCRYRCGRAGSGGADLSILRGKGQQTRVKHTATVAKNPLRNSDCAGRSAGSQDEPRCDQGP